MKKTMTPAILLEAITREEGTMGVSIWRFLQAQEATKKFGVGGRVVHSFKEMLRRFQPDNVKLEKWADVLADKLIRMAVRGWLRLSQSGEVGAI